MLENFANLWVGGTGFYSPVGFPNPRTSDDIDMKLGPVTKLDKRYKTTSKKITMTSCREIVTHCHFSNLWPIWSNLLFCKKNVDISKIKRTLVLNGIFSKTEYLCTCVANMKFLA